MIRDNRLTFMSLYFASIGYKQSLQNLFSLITLPFVKEDKLREKLHKNFSKRHGNAPVFSYSSARASLSALLKASNIGKNDEVIISSFSCLAVPTAIISTGARPVYYDLDIKTLNVTKESLSQLITKNTKAIIFQHTLGITVSTSVKDELNLDDDILIIEDCALSLGSTYNNQLIGDNSDAAIFSLELSKTISCGWGGLLLVNKPQLKKALMLQYKDTNQLDFIKSIRMSLQASISGILYSPAFYFFGKYLISIFFKVGLFAGSTPISEEKGIIAEDFVCKLPKTLLTLANIQISRIDEISRINNNNYKKIKQHLTKLKFHVFENQHHFDKSVSPRVPLLVRDRNNFIGFFKKNGIEVGTWFDGPLTPLPGDPIFNFSKYKYPNSNFLADHIVNLPCHSKMNEFYLNKIMNLLEDYTFKYPNFSKLKFKNSNDYNE